jgi:lipopolysaccharide assembly outer membrane protein LptD (OstA)
LLFFVVSSASAQEQAEPPIVCHGDKVEFMEQQQRLEAQGHVIVIYGDVKITCDQISISLDTKEGIAEGNIVVYQKDSVLTGEKVEYNFASQTGTVYQAGFASQLIYGEGPLAIKEGPKELTMRRTYMTTCDLPKPHYRIQAKTCKIFLDDRVVLRHAIVFLADFPLFYIPYYSYALKPERPKVTVTPGKDKDWGFFVLTAWRYEFNQYLKGVLHLDYRERRDFASGFDNYYQTKGYGKGFVKAYYMNERTLESKRLWKDPRITHERERYMIQHRHTWDIDDQTDLRFEYWNVSDTDILKDYFYNREYLRDATPESYLSISRASRYYSASLLAQRRFNKVFTRTEYQPELKLDIPSLRIGPEWSRFYWKSENSFANISKKYAYPNDLDEDTVRFDTFNKFSYASKLGFLHITPYVGGRETYYTKDENGDGDWWRWAFYSGVEVETRFYRVFPVNIQKWGLDINNLRHVVTPKVGYDYVREPTVSTDRFVQFDSLDSVSRLNQISLSLENKLQTKRTQGQVVDLARLIISTNYDYGLDSGSKFSDINFDFEFSPFSWLTLEFDTSYDHLQDRFKNFNLDIYADKSDKWKCGFGYRYAHEDHSEATLELSFKPTPLWKLGVYERFLFKGYPYGRKKMYELRQQEYRIIRDLHCWTSEIIYTVSRGEGESIYLVFRLKAFPDMPLEFGTSYHRPKPGSFDPIR